MSEQQTKIGMGPADKDAADQGRQLAFMGSTCGHLTKSPLHMYVCLYANYPYLG